MPFARTRLNIIPLLLVLIGLSLLIWSMPGALHGQRTPSIRDTPAGKQPAAELADPSKRAVDLRDQLDQLTGATKGLKDRLDSILRDATTAQWLLAMVLGAAGLFTLAQGFLAFFSAQNYVKQGDDAIIRANEAVGKANKAVLEATENADKAVARIDVLAADVRSKYPMFADIESARKDAFDQLSSLIPALDADQNLYAQSDSLMRQRIFAIESFSAIQFLTPANRSTELLGNLRLLGKFYAGKFALEHQSKSDFERSHYYFELALEKFGRPFTVLNDIGWLFSTVASPVDPETGRSFFEESLRRKPNQQRAHFDLATLIIDKHDKGKLEKARQRLLLAKEHANWEDAPNTLMASHIDYNLACVYDALAGFEVDPLEKVKLLDQCLTYIESAAKTGHQAETVVEADLQDGDLSNIARSEVHAQRLRAALAMYELVWHRPQH